MKIIQFRSHTTIYELNYDNCSRTHPQRCILVLHISAQKNLSKPNTLAARIVGVKGNNSNTGFDDLSVTSRTTPLIKSCPNSCT